jgi:acetate CoA/acetoacetate CoA-transferase alpha subunit
MMASKVSVDLVPQGTFVDASEPAAVALGRADAHGVGTLVEEGKRHIDVDGKCFLLETALRSTLRDPCFLVDYRQSPTP